MATREPGDLPSLQPRAGRGALAMRTARVFPRGRHPERVSVEPPASASCLDAPLARDPAVPRVTLFVCRTCRAPGADTAGPSAGAALADAVLTLERGADIAVRSVNCLSNCKRGLSAALVRDGGWSYVFGDLSLESGPDLMVGAALFSGSTDGLMPWRGRPDCLKRGMIARVPPLFFSEDSQ